MNELDNKSIKNPLGELSLDDIDEFIEKIRRQTQDTRKFITKVNQEIDNQHE